MVSAEPGCRFCCHGSLLWPRMVGPAHTGKGVRGGRPAAIPELRACARSPPSASQLLTERDYLVEARVTGRWS